MALFLQESLYSLQVPNSQVIRHDVVQPKQLLIEKTQGITFPPTI